MTGEVVYPERVLAARGEKTSPEAVPGSLRAT